MFCYQCEQTMGGKGCTKSGICGKTPEIANLQDLLIYQLKGISSYAKPLIEKGEHIDKEIIKFLENALFTTLTNVNFDVDFHMELLQESQKIKESIRNKAPQGNYSDAATYNLSNTKEEMLRDSVRAGLMYDQDLDADIRSLRSTVLYGLKGISAYGHQARYIDHHSDQVDQFYFLGLEAITNDNLTLEDMIRMTMRTGDMSIEVMSVLDEANTTRYKNPSPQKVNVNIKKGPFIIISGHDLRDLELLLEQTEGKGINIYTHGEMLPAHGYPGLNKYKHLVGNYGSAWQNQQKEFDGIPGCILMTTNCLMKPRDTYKDRLYVTNVVGWDGIKKIELNEDGTKDFSEIINKA
jgi:hydroxylamine reductase